MKRRKEERGETKEKENKTGKSLAERRAAKERKSVACWCFDDATGRNWGKEQRRGKKFDIGCHC
jgi:hypothetical protein